ncbi:MAG: DNA-binding transcriptional regulator [Syntrophomonadaceae bacterium]|jgi:TrpR-related protein YerC/YecD|nr:DNA-binding transcriptional regulator [Syntrophomonadaceae bacterium]
MAFEPVWRSAETDILVKALLFLQNEEDVNRFLDDLCTIAEIKALGQRLAVAQLLTKEATYSAIVTATGASTTTVSRVKRALNYGSDGYKRVLTRMDKEIVYE